MTNILNGEQFLRNMTKRASVGKASRQKTRLATERALQSIIMMQ